MLCVVVFCVVVLFHFTNCHYGEFYAEYAEFHLTKCHYIVCSYSEGCYAECNYTGFCYTVCYSESRGAVCS